MIEKLRKIVESLGYPFFFGTRDEVYAYINSVQTVVACYRQGGGGSQQFFVFKFKGDKPQRMYEEVMREIKRQFTVGVQRVFFYDDVLEARFPLMTKTYTEGGARPTPPPPPVGNNYMYFEAAEANSTVSLMSMLTTAPNLEYSTDGETWQEWQHTTEEVTHTFDTLTLTNIGDRVYLRGENNDLYDIANHQMTMFVGSGKMNSGGNITSLFNKTGEDSEIGGAAALFANMTGTSDFLLSAPTLNMTGFTNIDSLMMLFYGQTSLATPAYMPNITFEDVFPETTGVDLEGTQMYAMYSLTQVRLVSEDYMSIPSMPSFSLGNTVYFNTSSDPAYPSIMNAENVALFLLANINTVRVTGRGSVSGGYFFIDGGLNAGTKSSVSIRDGRTVTFVAVPESGYHIVKWIKADPIWSGTADTDIPDSATLTLAYNLPVKEGDTLYEAAIEPVFELD